MACSGRSRARFTARAWIETRIQGAHESGLTVARASRRARGLKPTRCVMTWHRMRVARASRRARGLKPFGPPLSRDVAGSRALHGARVD